MARMVLKDPSRAVSVVSHYNRDYKPDKKGVFEVEDGHVDAVRPHGFELESEAKQRAQLATIPDKDAEITKLKARLAELEAAPKK